MDGGALVGLGQRYLLVGAVEGVGTVGEPVGPGDQGGAVGAVADRVAGVGVEDVAVGHRVRSDPTADLDDGGPVVAGVDLEMLTRRRRGGHHGFLFCMCD